MNRASSRNICATRVWRNTPPAATTLTRRAPLGTLSRLREREGPAAQRWEGEGSGAPARAQRSRGRTLTPRRLRDGSPPLPQVGEGGFSLRAGPEGLHPSPARRERGF